jgi:hypothetical protein
MRIASSSDAVAAPRNLPCSVELVIDIGNLRDRVQIKGQPHARLCVERSLWPLSEEDANRLQSKSHTIEDGADMCPICLEAVEPQASGEVREYNSIHNRGAMPMQDMSVSGAIG